MLADPPYGLFSCCGSREREGLKYHCSVLVFQPAVSQRWGSLPSGLSGAFQRDLGPISKQLHLP